ncbi:hypothetical protein K438DRAFT_1982092 [Mycena galopus ATCC 62051]|nr:hypothetical protein K438DRAFT_1982092 [Mycena galopus ATCC 62051]
MLVLASREVRAPHASASAKSEPRKGEAVDLESDTANEVLLEKGSEAHILSCAVIEPSALDALQGWCTAYSDHPSAQLPDAEDVQGSAVRSVVTHDAGLTCQRTKGRASSQARRSARVLAEGAHGSLNKQAVAMYDLRRGKRVQTYGIGVKEVWRVEEGKHVPGCPNHHPHFHSLLAGNTRLAYSAHPRGEQLLVSAAARRSGRGVGWTGMLAAEAAFAALHPAVRAGGQKRAPLPRPLHHRLSFLPHAHRPLGRAQHFPQPLPYLPNALATVPASSFSPIAYPAFEPPLSTDLMSNVAEPRRSLFQSITIFPQRTPARITPKAPPPPPTHAKSPSGGVHTCAPTSAPTRDCASAAGVYEFVADEGEEDR